MNVFFILLERRQIKIMKKCFKDFLWGGDITYVLSRGGGKLIIGRGTNP